MGASLEVADIFRAAGASYRAAQAGHLSLAQLKVMPAIQNCRTPALGGHVEGCDECGHLRIAYNSCPNRHCPRCQGAAARTWLAERQADLLNGCFRRWLAPKQSFRFREEFRTPAGVGKSPKNEPADRGRGAMGI